MKTHKPIPDWENYGISEDAEIVRLVARKGAQQGLVLKQHLHKTRGYLTVRLYDRDRKKTFDVHRLMAMTFLGGVPDGMHVCHISGEKTDCRLINLRVDTPASNESDKVVHGTSNRGERFGRSKYTEEQVLKAKQLLAKKWRLKDVSDATGISLGSVKAISSGANWYWLKEKK